jgi:hypothetical protein
MTQVGWVSLVEHLIWPITIVVLVIVLRRQIGDFLLTIGGRIKQVSVMSVTIELAATTETVPSWRSAFGQDVRGLVAADNVSDSYFGTLRDSLRVPGLADFFVADLKSEGNHEWLTSRLYLFTYMLSRMKGIRCVVFTATRNDLSRYFLGIADAEELLRVLATAQPRLRVAQLQAETNQVGLVSTPVESSRPSPIVAPPSGWFPGDVDQWWQNMRANPFQTDPLHIAQEFLRRVQWIQPEGAEDPGADWLKLPNDANRNMTWEHATWITTSDLTDGILRDVVDPDSFVIDNRSVSSDERVRAIAQARRDFVALLSPTHRFERLINRLSLLEMVATAQVEQ